MKYRAVVFDLYDTLLYATGSGTREKAMEAAAARGIRREDWLRGWRAQLAGSLRGRIPRLLDRVASALAEAGFRDRDCELADELAGLMLTRDVPRLYGDVRSALAELKQHYRLGLISNIEPHQRHWIHELDLGRYFDAVILSCEVGLLKPEPEIYRLACERLSVAAAECVYVGDGMAGELPGAKAVGMVAVRIDRSPRDEDEPRDEIFDVRVASLRELLEWLLSPPRPARNG
jgi:putative hydrolase of the HAD superfamily